MIKKLLKNSLIQYILAIIAAIYIFLVRLTSKIEKVNYDIPQSFWNNNKPFILAFWHNQLMMISFTWSKNLKINIIASQHSDGRFGSIVGRFFKLRNIPRSSKNSNASLKNIFKLVKKNEYIGITPDGPRGPNQKVSDGIIKLASILQIPIISCGFWSSKNFQLNSWDKFLITLPFSRCYFVWSDPIYIEKKISEKKISSYQIMLEKNLNNNIEKAKNKITNNV
ncbi:MAG: hypothetical protein CFH21_00218 [Alphaproteobacteria bacterium MarineAlpha5_Bin11]|nr:MAG: hypothetical protein CFH21_00218 [Alphaproteobacteria bacterium MarineAlpha5_Bin11]PPR52188.1 MAG: hypothetical protein CFH20_00093 [Alphaproteobacteria bacterium MarineAlpha5_Bin10]